MEQIAKQITVTTMLGELFADDGLEGESRRKVADVIEQYRDALLWCAGSPDFQVGGVARNGWNKLVKPLLEDVEGLRLI